MLLPIATDKKEIINIDSRMLARHGLIAGATGTGKTVSIQVLCEAFSDIGVPSFVADVKGDFSGISQAGQINEKLSTRLSDLAISNHEFRPYPVVFWDLFGEKGHKVRTTISEMGPTLFSRLMDLNDTQSGILNIAFRIADDEGLLLLDLKDLRHLLTHLASDSKNYSGKYGQISTVSINTILRNLLQLEDAGLSDFFGEPALNLFDLIKTDFSGKGIVNILSADKLFHKPVAYTTFLLWMLSELFENLPEVGDLEKPKLVFFFDEAHLLFDNPNKAFLEKINQIIRLIRSKGVGIFFITQNPADIPDEILGQLGNRIQHAIRAYTPKDVEAIRTIKNTFRPNPEVDVEKSVTTLQVGEALISFLDEKGVPAPVSKAFIFPPHSRIGPITTSELDITIKKSEFFGKYENVVDRESAYEILSKKATQSAADNEKSKATDDTKKDDDFFSTGEGKFVKSLGKSFLRSVSYQMGSRITRGILGTILGKK